MLPIAYRRVQNLLDERSTERTQWGRNPEYILTGIIRCALCGQAYTPASTRRGETRIPLLPSLDTRQARHRRLRGGPAARAGH
jgi:hypothetical protein